MTLMEHFQGLFFISLCGWGLFCLYLIFSVKCFINRRFEEETDLLNTKAFREHLTFIRYLPNHMAASIYATHLIELMWLWNWIKNRKAYTDIKNPEYILQHFSKKELRRVKWFAVSMIIIILHGIAYYLFRFIWPETFN